MFPNSCHKFQELNEEPKLNRNFRDNIKNENFATDTMITPRRAVSPTMITQTSTVTHSLSFCVLEGVTDFPMNPITFGIVERKNREVHSNRRPVITMLQNSR